MVSPLSLKQMHELKLLLVFVSSAEVFEFSKTLHFLLFKKIVFVCVDLCICGLWRPEEGTDPLELKLKEAGSHLLC